MLDNFLGNLARGAFRLGLLTDKHSPELLIIGGVLASAAAIYTTVTATLQVNEVLEKANADKAQMETVRETHPEAYDETAYQHDLKVVRKDVTVGMVKLYYKPALFFLLSTTCYLAAHKILKDRNVAIAAALKVTQEAFDKYRERVRAKEGDAADRYYRFGEPAGNDVEAVCWTEGENGEMKDIVVSGVKDPNEYSQYARCFTDGCPEFTNTPEFNLMYLRARQNYFNDILKIRGHVFLNEVYRDLGFQDTKAGSVVGWVLSKDGDNFIDFGLYDKSNKETIDFINGIEPSVWLDFNVDGVIYDKI